MTDVETRIYPIEKLREFCTRVFLHFGVPKDDAVRAADVLACADLRGIDSQSVRIRQPLSVINTVFRYIR